MDYSWDWIENQQITQRGLIPPEAFRHPYLEEEKFIMLNGDWDILHFSSLPNNIDELIHRENLDWDRIVFPGHLELQGYGTPIYVNDRYPFDPDPPRISVKNSCSILRKKFSCPTWLDNHVRLYIGAIKSAAYIFLNGHFLAYNQDSKTEVQVDLTEYVGEDNTITIVLFRYCDGSYLECQDFWRLSGITRDIYVERRNKIRFTDHNLTPSYNMETGMASLDISLSWINENTTSKSGKVRIDILYAGEVFQRISDNIDLADSAQGKWDSTTHLKDVLPWDEDNPHLYSVHINLEVDAQPLDTIISKVGFRNIEIVKNRLLLNGKPLLIKGVNRHEHEPSIGQVVSKESMRKDVELLKKYNFNAVRNSHYPCDPYWYALCDEYGIYLVDEANIESHGMGYEEKSLAKNIEWLPAHLERMERCYHRSKNHSSIIIWSMGNEAGDGIIFEKMYARLKKLDPSRPIQYEQAAERSHTDIVCPMYPSPQAVNEYAEKRRDRPYILCEYSHAMGNSNGNLIDYWDIIWKHDCLQGGFIWDWVDQGLEVELNGKKDYVHGGYYATDTTQSDGNFCMNGLLDPDRKPHPAIHEIIKINQPIKLKLKGDQVHVENHFFNKSIEDFVINIGVSNADKELKYQTHNINIAVDGSMTIQVAHPLDGGSEYFIDVTVEDASGNHVASEQFIVHEKIEFDLLGIPPRFQLDNLVVDINPHTGWIENLIIDNESLLNEPLKINMWRAPVDNDYGWGLPEKSKIYKSIIDRLEVKEKTIQKEASLYLLKDEDDLVSVQMSYRKIGAAALLISVEISCDESLPEIPRVGIHGGLLSSFNKVTWMGRGPHENYMDRKYSAHMGRFSSEVSELYTPYISPQENGARQDCRWVYLSEKKAGPGLMLQSDLPFSFSYLPYAVSELTRGDRDDGHRSQLPTSTENHLSIDYKHMGLGGIDSWLSPPLDRYRIKEKKFNFKFVLKAVINEC